MSTGQAVLIQPGNPHISALIGLLFPQLSGLQNNTSPGEYQLARHFLLLFNLQSSNAGFGSTKKSESDTIVIETLLMVRFHTKLVTQVQYSKSYIPSIPLALL